MNEKQRKQLQIREKLREMRQHNISLSDALKDSVDLSEYRDLAQSGKDGLIWTKALQQALFDHEVVVIPASGETYWIDDTVRIPSNRKIIAYGAAVQLVAECRVLMLRNERTRDGSHAPIDGSERDHNISIYGGRWAESRDRRAVNHEQCIYDAEDSMSGVYACMLFNNMQGLTLSDVTFVHTAGYSVQTGDITDALFENIRFEQCFADGLHINGNAYNVWAREISGQVGDDLVALNMYDWLDCAIDYGPADTVLCEGLYLDPASHYRALRILPGVYTYDDGSKAQCSLTDAIISRVTGIETFKMYFQTPCYAIGTDPEPGEVGKADNIFFEDITVDLGGPVDPCDEYLRSDPIRGYFGAFELGSEIGYVSFRNIDLTLHKDQYPLSKLVCCGPKSIRAGEYEVFDPYMSSSVECMEFDAVRVNGKIVETLNDLMYVSSFVDVNRDGRSTGRGTVGKVFLNGKEIG